LSGRMAKWAIFLSQFGIVLVPQKAMKGQFPSCTPYS
jgi:hypothetical protein